MHQEITPSLAWINIFDVDSVPLTSVRSSITFLAKKGYLVKTQKTKIGMFGYPEHIWKIK
jgi:hypothetical protein